MKTTATILQREPGKGCAMIVGDPRAWAPGPRSWEPSSKGSNMLGLLSFPLGANMNKALLGDRRWEPSPKSSVLLGLP